LPEYVIVWFVIYIIHTRVAVASASSVMQNGERCDQPDWVEQKWELRLPIVAPIASRSLQFYPSTCIQQVLEKLAGAALLRRFHAVNET
jgi:hypothetical protein